MDWNTGKPPTVGWYAVKRARDPGWLNGHRWWDGDRWSWAAFPHESEKAAAIRAKLKEPKGHNFEMLWQIPDVAISATNEAKRR